MTFLKAYPEVSIALVPSTESRWDFLIGFRIFVKNKSMIHTHVLSSNIILKDEH